MATHDELAVGAHGFVGGGAVPLGFQQITGLTSAKSLTVPTGAVLALIEAEDQAVRWRDDGTAPTATVGMTIGSGEQLTYTGDLSAFKVIEDTATAKVNVSYYGRHAGGS